MLKRQENGFKNLFFFVLFSNFHIFFRLSLNLIFGRTTGGVFILGWNKRDLICEFETPLIFC